MDIDHPVSEVRRPNYRRRRFSALAGGVLALVGAAALVPLSTSAPASAGTQDGEGLQCLANGGSSSFALTAGEGRIATPDGNSVYMWGLAPSNGAFQYPGPVLCVFEGDTVTISLTNHLPNGGGPNGNTRTSLVFPGNEGVTVNGDPAKPEFDTNANMTSLIQTANSGETKTYQFVAGHAGTYLYESGTDQALQVGMGLAGTLVVRPQAAGDTDAAGNGPAVRLAYNDPRTKFESNHEYLMMLSEVDPDLHSWVESNVGAGLPLNWASYPDIYRPKYFFINGRSFPDTISQNNAPWLPSQPYGALAHVEPQTPAQLKSNPSLAPALLRYVSFGPKTYPFHPHANHETLVGKDGRMLSSFREVTNQDLSKSYTSDGEGLTSTEMFAIPVEPGETIDATFFWEDVDHFDAATNPVFTPVPQIKDLMDGTYWNGTPYLGGGVGGTGIHSPNTNQNDQCGSLYNVAHSHDLSQATTYGASMGGMLTLIRIDPQNAQCGD